MNFSKTLLFILLLGNCGWSLSQDCSATSASATTLKSPIINVVTANVTNVPYSEFNFAHFDSINADVIVVGNSTALASDVTQFIQSNHNENQHHTTISHDGTASRIRAGGATNGMVFSISDGFELPGQQDYTEALRLLPNGNVGIGTSTPTHKLTVNGRAQLDSLIIGSNSQPGVASSLTPGRALTINGAVHISPEDSIPTPFPTQINDQDISEYLLWVEQGIVTDGVIIASPDIWADHVFQPEYELLNLDSVQQFIAMNGHLPHLPSAEGIAASGYSTHEMKTLLLQKIEELTLYIIQQEEEIDKLTELEEQLNSLENKMKARLE